MTKDAVAVMRYKLTWCIIRACFAVQLVFRRITMNAAPNAVARPAIAVPSNMRHIGYYPHPAAFKAGVVLIRISAHPSVHVISNQAGPLRPTPGGAIPGGSLDPESAHGLQAVQP